MPRAAQCLVLVGLASLGCSVPHLAGTNDAALAYAVEPEPATRTESTAITAGRVKARLSAALIAADVDVFAEPDGERVRVTVDADATGAVDTLLLWRGGLDAFRVDDTFVLAPPDTGGLRPMSDPRPGGTVERWWQGESEQVSRAISATKLDPWHVAFAERLATDEWRTRVVVAPPLVQLGSEHASVTSIQPAAHGRALALTFVAGARQAIASERAIHPAARVALARGRMLVATMTADEALASPLILPFGDDIRAYTRAANAKRLLGSPVLPPLRRASAERLPPRWGMASACVLFPFALSFAWLFFVRRFDRSRPEPMWLVMATFALGGLSVVPAAAVELVCAKLTPWLDPSLVTLGGQAWALPLAIAVSTLVVGVSEEGAKFASVWSLARRRHEFDEPIDGIVYGCAAALGFAAVENVKYFVVGRMSGVLIALRAFVTLPSHMFFGAIWGYAMGRKLVSRRTRVLAFFALAASAHGAFDGLLSADGMQPLATLLVLVLALAFVAMLRRALRYGAVPPRERRIEETSPASAPAHSSLPRAYFRVGSPLAFYASAASMIACAFGLTVLGATYEILHHRIGIVFVALATTTLALFGLASYSTSATIPLDVAVDAQGLTFAGMRTAWTAVAGFHVEVSGKRAFVVLRSPDQARRLGPARIDVAQAIANAIRLATLPPDAAHINRS